VSKEGNMTQHLQATEQICPPQAHSMRPGLRSILVVVDPTAREHPCVQKAARLAQASGAALELYICDAERDLPLGWSAGDNHRALRESRRAALLSSLERLAAPLRSQGLRVVTECEWRVPLEHGIAQHVLASQPDLVVKDSHHHQQPMQGTLTRTDWILIRLIEKPLLLVRPGSWRKDMHITIGADPCRPAQRPVALDESMLAFGEVLETALRANLNVLHVLRPPPHLPGDAVSEDEKHRTYAAQRRAVEQLVEGRIDRGSPLLIEFFEGAVAPGILEFARTREPDILILGAAARPRWVHTPASGTAAQVLEDLRADLLVIKPPGFVSPLLVTDE
jgi:universal stress protein E